MTLNHIDIGKGEVILFLHGLGSRKEAWELQHKFSDSYRLLIPDLRGHGESTVTNGITMDNFVNDLLELLDSKGIEQVTVCGLSMGGVIAQHLVSKAPGRVKSLILANTFAYAPYPGMLWEVNIRLSELKRETDEKYISNVIKHCMYQYTDEKAEHMWKAFKINRKIYGQASHAVMNACSNFWKSYRLLTSINVPTLIIASVNDRVVPLSFLVGMRVLIKNAVMVVLERTGHMSNVDNPEGFNAAVSNFLEATKEKTLVKKFVRLREGVEK